MHGEGRRGDYIRFSVFPLLQGDIGRYGHVWDAFNESYIFFVVTVTLLVKELLEF